MINRCRRLVLAFNPARMARVNLARRSPGLVVCVDYSDGARDELTGEQAVSAGLIDARHLP